MCARDHQHLFAAQKLMVQNLRQRTERDAPIEHVLQFHVAAGNSIAYYHEVWLRLQVLDGKRLGQWDIERCQKIRHWRIRRRVGAGYAKFASLQHAGQRRHRRTADPNQVDVFVLGHDFVRANASLRF